MKNNIKEQFAQLFWDLHPQLTTAQQQTCTNTLIALDQLATLLYELQQAHGIIHNCINSMTAEQRLQVASNNYLDHLSAQWAFRSSERQEVLQRGKSILKRDFSEKLH